MLSGLGLRVSAGRTVLLDQLSVDLRPGRVTALLGPNGAGKSTLLQTLVGLRTPDLGSVLLDDQPILGLGPQERAQRIGYLPQSAPLHWNLEVRALVALGRHPRRARFGPLSAEDEQAIDAALAMTDMAGFAGRLSGSLSGGELARAQLARVLAGEPQWILADEPFAALDIAHRLDLADKFRAIAASGVGVVVILHDIVLAGRIADDLLLLDRGRLVAAGPASKILASPDLGRVFGVRLEQHVHADGRVSLIADRHFS